MEEDPPSDISSIDISAKETPPTCTVTNCFSADNEEEVLKCSVTKCSRLVHFKCSKLPAYQVQIHLNNQNKRKTKPRTKLTFICFNCVDVSKEIESLCEDHEGLKRKIDAHEQMIEDYKEAATELAVKVKNLKTANKNLKEKHVETRTVAYLDKKIQDQMNALGETIKTTILNEIQSSLAKVEDHVTEAKTSYANATKGASPVMASGLKTIVKEARYEELKEKRDHDSRTKNVIIHGVAESADDDIKKEDKDFVDNLIKTMKIPTPKVKLVSRIGTQAADKKRPIKVVLGSDKEKMTFLRNLSILKGKNEFKGISITEDLTLTERSVLKEWANKAKDLNLDDPDFVWRVRGDSKNGYRLKKFTKIQKH